jgi:hypothetical protein
MTHYPYGNWEKEEYSADKRIEQHGFADCLSFFYSKNSLKELGKHRAEKSHRVCVCRFFLTYLWKNIELNYPVVYSKFDYLHLVLIKFGSVRQKIAFLNDK